MGLGLWAMGLANLRVGRSQAAPTHAYVPRRRPRGGISPRARRPQKLGQNRIQGRVQERAIALPLSRSGKARRGLTVAFVLSGLLSLCAFRLAHLQLIQGQDNLAKADQNRIATSPIPSDRGNILDRQGRLLATNQLSRSIYLHPRHQTELQWQTSAQHLGQILEIPSAEILAKLKQRGYRSAAPVRILRDLSPKGFIRLAEHSQTIPGVEVRREANRSYPQGDIAAHVLGYIGEASEADLKANPSWPMGMIVGQMGIERIANPSLKGEWGGYLVEKDGAGHEVQFLGEKPAISGQAVQLTLDLDLQKAAEKALAKRRGAVVVLNAKTGAVLALASGPSFNPNWFTRRMTSTELQQFENPEKPFLNRALQPYPPASTFKIISTVAGLESGTFQPNSTLMTMSALNVGGTLFHEHGAGYGVIGFPEALAVSSNTFYYQVGLKTGPEAISQWAQKLGVGNSATALDLDGASSGSVPTPEQKKKLYDEDWHGGDTVMMAIGQGVVQVTPLELAVMIAAMGNGGNRVTPHLLSHQTSQFLPQPTGIKASTLAVVKQGLVQVVQAGTARQLADGSIPPTAGKTGTAEVVGQRDNAMYVGFGPVNDPQIAVAVVVENGGFGAESAVPIAHEVYRTYFKTPARKP
jgi:penicillin-binding protein 2